MRRRHAILLATPFWLATTGPASTNNGLNLIGYNAEGVGMGGADVAVARDALSLTINPAGMSWLEESRFDFLGAIAYADTAHQDRFADGIGNENKLLYLGNLGVAVPIPRLHLTLGAGLFAQGGSGVEYHNIETIFGTRDDLSSLFRIGKLALGAAFKVDDRLSLGLSPVLFLADLNQRLYPNTSFVGPDNTFFGLKVDGLTGFAEGVQLGAMYRVTPEITLGVTYSPQSDLDLENGSVRANFEAIGLGRVKYRDAEVDGFGVPQQASVGASLRVLEELLLAFKLTWINWDGALNEIKLKAKKPNDPRAPSTLMVRTDFDWQDQYVVAIGAEYRIDEAIKLRCGYNYANNPIPNATLNALFPLTTEHHITVGLGYDAGSGWEIASALEYAMPSRVTYSSPQALTGRQTEDSQLVGIWMQLSYKW